jgi:hypothetical protein
MEQVFVGKDNKQHASYRSACPLGNMIKRQRIFPAPTKAGDT